MQRGFSLVELSIVLVILGLLVGGILSGQSLIRASELRSLTSDVMRLHAARNSFRDKYFAWPGDMPNAVKFWGAQAGTTTDGVNATCLALSFSSPSTDARTCNGNGDGLISFKESWRGWQQLANAGLIEGTYTGVPGSGSDDSWATPGLNSPASKLGGGFAYIYVGQSTGATLLFDGYYGNNLRYGSGNGIDQNPGLVSPEEVWNIDTKLDDGKPGYGSVRVYKSSARPCATTDDPATAVYQLTNTVKGCNVYFWVGS